MQISYKFWYVTTDNDSGLITEAAVRFYEGDDAQIEETDPLTQAKSTVTRYVRTKRLEPKDIPELDAFYGAKDEDGKDIPPGFSYRQESDGSYARVYTPSDFGKISKMDELRLFLNKEMAKHLARPNQKDQAEVNDIKKVL